MNKLEQWAQNVGNFFKNLGKELGINALGSFLEQAFVAIRPQVIAELKDIALDAVTVAEAAFTSPGSGKQKAAQAFATIASDAKAIALGATANEVNTVMELAVGVINGPAASAPAPAASVS